MTSVTLKFIIKPSLSIKSFVKTFFLETDMERNVTTNSDVLLKDVCIDIMHNIGLGHLSHISKVLIKISDFKYHTFDSFIPDLNLNVGSLKPIFGSSLVIKILVPGKVEDFNEQELKKSLCSNILQLIIAKYPLFKDCITDPILKNILESIENDSISALPYESILQLNKAVECEVNLHTKNEKEELPTEISDVGKKLESQITPESIISIKEIISQQNKESPLLFGEGIDNSMTSFNESLLKIFDNIPSPSSTGMSTSPQKSIVHYRSRISFDQIREAPILEKWFSTTKKPSPCQLQQFADHLNNFSRRPEEAKISPQNIKIWFKNRRAKGKGKKYTSSSSS